MANAQQGLGALRGRVMDEFDRVILTATVTITDEAGREIQSNTAADGVYQFSRLSPGTYQLTASAAGFAQYTNEFVIIVAGPPQYLEISLGVAIGRARVTVPIETSLGVEAEENAGAIVRREDEFSALPNDPESLLAALNALAGPTAGQDDRDVIVDGFNSSRIPRLSE